MTYATHHPNMRTPEAGEFILDKDEAVDRYIAFKYVWLLYPVRRKKPLYNLKIFKNGACIQEHIQ